MTPSNDPYKTQPLAPITATLARPVQLPLAAIVALVAVPALVLGGLVLLWMMQQQAATSTKTALLPSPTLGVPGAVAAARGLPRAVVAFDAPGGRILGALEPGRPYEIVARSGLDWVQLDVREPGEAANRVWVLAGDVPEVQAAAGLQDVATPVPTATPLVVYVAAPTPQPAPVTPIPAPIAEPVALAPEPTAAYVLPPPTWAPRSVVFRAFPTATPCSLRDLGSSLQLCNGYQP